MKRSESVVVVVLSAVALVVLAMASMVEAGETSGEQFHPTDPYNFFSSLSSNPVQTYSFKSDFYGHARDNNAAVSLSPLLAFVAGLVSLLLTAF
eukprot:TRINITY_DN517_c0_g1_i1.p2 TRINITY_DN517_c0_g1~~TRINITY_DN517_c0_g1_i1.p2  ORF type:complete len:110 (+),score=36.05 TRINITY_DN517_c0_g1_i1:51-332(+)